MASTPGLLPIGLAITQSEISKKILSYLQMKKKTSVYHLKRGYLKNQLVHRIIIIVIIIINHDDDDDDDNHEGYHSFERFYLHCIFSLVCFQNF